VAVARALARQPDIVLLDEPFAALDANLRQRVRLDVRDALAAAGVTAVLVTHDQAEALSLGDRVVLMRAGRVLQAGSPVDLYSSPVDEWAARFIGEATVLDARLAGGVATTVLGPLLVRTGPDVTTGDASVVLRPDQIVLHEPGAGVPASWKGTVRRAEYYGHDAVVDVQVAVDDGPGLTVTARVPGHDLPAVGAVVEVSLDGEVVAVRRD
jgi:iron(III) transport system ATP-binding protein